MSLPTSCANCSKRTNKVNRSDQNPELCKTCFRIEEIDLDHQNDMHDEEPVKDCPSCQQNVLDGDYEEDDTPADDAPVAPAVAIHGKHFSHAACDHESTPRARQQCRTNGAAAAYYKELAEKA